MRDGVLQQLAQPKELYDNPANVYVAGFIGSLKMNFVPVGIEDGLARAEGLELPLERPVAAREAILGIRPEYFEERPTNGMPSVRLGVDIVEVLGSDQLLYGTVGGNRLVARVSSQLPARSGDSVTLGLPRHSIHLFDKQTEQALL
jgi:ABC-type sugar transport system ATPase subunit